MIVGSPVMLSHVDDVPKLLLDGMELQFVDNYEYLGVKLTNTLTMDKAIQYLSSSFS